jgi:DNA-binding response OmpR family regulator
MPHEKAEILMRGFDVHLLKPIDPDTLCTTVAALLKEEG